MNIKGLIFISMLILIPAWSCEKKGDLIELHFNETGCANPWDVSTNDPDYINKVKLFLEAKNITIKDISRTNNGSAYICLACSCTTGRIINITINSIDKNLALEIGFYQDEQ